MLGRAASRSRFLISLGIVVMVSSIGLAQTNQAVDLGAVPQGAASTAVRLVPWSTLPGNIAQADFLAGGSGDLFFATTQGQVWRYDAAGNRDTTPFLDVAAVRGGAFNTTVVAHAAGLKGIAFHPDFHNASAAGYRKLYTAHSEFLNSGTPSHALEPSWALQSPAESVLVEWMLDATTGRIDPGSYRQVMRVQVSSNHHPGGSIVFNPTANPTDADYGKLYWGIGDGGTTPGGPGIDSNRTGLDNSNLQSTIVRIDPLQDGSNPYSVPTGTGGNLLANDGEAGTLGEIFAYGFRHPQTLSFDRASGKLLVGEISQNNVEEINLVVNGGNYGYGNSEGTYLYTDQRLPSQGQNADPSLVEIDLNNSQNVFIRTAANPAGATQTILSRTADDMIYPVAQFDHKNNNLNGRTAIVGGHVYRGALAAELNGLYLFGNLATDQILLAQVTDLVNDEVPAAILELPLVDSNGDPTTLATIVGNNRANMRFAQDANGEIYLISKANDTIYRFEGTLTPEPGTWLLLVLGVMGWIAARRRTRRAT